MDATVLEQAGFPAATLEDWKKLTGKVLKGADFDQTLVTLTADGIAIQPLAQRRQAAEPLLASGARGKWTINQRVDDPDPDRAERQIDADLANGASGLSLVFANSLSAYGAGVNELSERIVKKLAAAKASIRIENAGSLKSVSWMASFLDTPLHPPVHCGLDIFSSALLSETGLDPAHIRSVADIAQSLVQKHQSGTIFNADGRFAHHCGATEAQELAIIVAALVDTARHMEVAGLSPETVLAKTSLCVSVTQNQFLMMAKLRALRLMTAKIRETLGLGPADLHVYAETSWRMLTELDPETNILRNTIAACSAGMAGADEITVLPHSLSFGLPDPLARRLARNTQVILSDECHLAHVRDAAAGAGSLETLTDALAEKAWADFQTIEAQGGLAAAIKQGTIRDWISLARRQAKVPPIVGTTIYPLKAERPAEILAALKPVHFGNGLQPQRLDQVTTAQQGEKTQ